MRRSTFSVQRSLSALRARMDVVHVWPAVALILFLAGCGVKGALVPPESLAPAPVTDLRVEQQGEHFLVSWSRPGREAGGQPLKDLAGFRLLRHEILPPGEDCEACPSAYRQVAAIDLEYLQGVIVEGNRYFFLDSDVGEGKSFRYKVASYRRDGTPSLDSNRVGRKWEPPPQPPVVKVLSSTNSVRIEWAAPPAPTGGRIVGYDVFRTKSGGAFPATPLNSAPITGSAFEETAVGHGIRYRYAVRTVAVADGETVESGLSNEVEGEVTESE